MVGQDLKHFWGFGIQLGSQGGSNSTDHGFNDVKPPLDDVLASLGCVQGIIRPGWLVKAQGPLLMP